MNNYISITETLKASNTKLVAVSKTKPIEAIQVLYDLGQRVFGENRVQELAEKHEALPKDIEWHLIGHLQKNKVKYIASFVAMIHSIDSFDLLKIVDNEATKNDRKIEILLQIKIAREDSKYGFDGEKLIKQLKTEDYPNVIFRGVMGMATFTNDQNLIRSEFKKLVEFKNRLKTQHFENSSTFDEISMGMSGDYKIACEEGSTMVRIGSLIFGERK